MAVWNSETARIAGSAMKPSSQRDYRDAMEIQRVLKTIATAKDTAPSAASQAAKTWCELMNVRRLLRGLGAPKAVPAANDPSAAPKRKQGRASVNPAAPASDAPLD